MSKLNVIEENYEDITGVFQLWHIVNIFRSPGGSEPKLAEYSISNAIFMCASMCIIYMFILYYI